MDERDGGAGRVLIYIVNERSDHVVVDINEFNPSRILRHESEVVLYLVFSHCASTSWQGHCYFALSDTQGQVSGIQQPV